MNNYNVWENIYFYTHNSDSIFIRIYISKYSWLQWIISLKFHPKWCQVYILWLFRIYRDKLYGIPHIHSNNLKDGYYGLGFVHA